MSKSFDDINLEENERRLDRLFDQYGEAPVREVHKSPASDEFEEWVAMSRTGYIGSAYAFVRRSPGQFADLTESYEVDGEERERVLLILGRGNSEWGVPGGGQESDETYEATVHREVSEEVGVEISLTGIGHVRHEISTADGFDERLHALRVFFEAEYESGAIKIQPGELNGAAWFAHPPTDRLLPDTASLVNSWQQ